MVLYDSGKEAFPKLTFLNLSHFSCNHDENQDWSCLKRIDLPNLTDLALQVGLREIVYMIKPTAKLPKLKRLIIFGYNYGHPRRDWENNAEEIFSSPLLHQLEELNIMSSHFRVGSLRILCSHAKKFKNLISLCVHCYDMEGVRIIANAGRVGGFPNLEKISFYDMDYYLIECLLRPVWPDIKYACWIGEDDQMAKYGQPDEFAEVDQIEELQELHIVEGDNAQGGAE